MWAISSYCFIDKIKYPQAHNATWVSGTISHNGFYDLPVLRCGRFEHKKFNTRNALWLKISDNERFWLLQITVRLLHRNIVRYNLCMSRDNTVLILRAVHYTETALCNFSLLSIPGVTFLVYLFALATLTSGISLLFQLAEPNKHIKRG